MKRLLGGIVAVNPALSDYAMHQLAAGQSPGTVRAYLGHIGRLAHQHPNLLAVTDHQLEQYLAMRRVTHAAESRKAIRAALRSFYRWAHSEKLIVHDPAAGLPPIRVPRTVPRLADDDRLLHVLAHACSRDRALILLGRMAGLRLSEIASLHTDQRHGDILIIRGKGEKERVVPINDDLWPALAELEVMNGAGYYFPGMLPGSHLHPQSVNKIITRVAGTNPHSLRHAAATAAYNSTHDLRAVQEFLGHASLATTQRYLHVDLEQVRAVGHGAEFARAEHLATRRRLPPTYRSSGQASTASTAIVMMLFLGLATIKPFVP